MSNEPFFALALVAFLAHAVRRVLLLWRGEPPRVVAIPFNRRQPHREVRWPSELPVFLLAAVVVWALYRLGQGLGTALEALAWLAMAATTGGLAWEVALLRRPKQPGRNEGQAGT